MIDMTKKFLALAALISVMLIFVPVFLTAVLLHIAVSR